MSGIDIKEILRQQRQDADDKRCMRGKHAPRPGICRVCSGKVVATIDFDHGDRIGGPPVQGHVSGWHCESCEIVYRVCPRTRFVTDDTEPSK